MRLRASRETPARWCVLVVLILLASACEEEDTFYPEIPPEGECPLEEHVIRQDDLRNSLQFIVGDYGAYASDDGTCSQDAQPLRLTITPLSDNQERDAMVCGSQVMLLDYHLSSDDGSIDIHETIVWGPYYDQTNVHTKFGGTLIINSEARTFAYSTDELTTIEECCEVQSDVSSEDLEILNSIGLTEYSGAGEPLEAEVRITGAPSNACSWNAYESAISYEVVDASGEVLGSGSGVAYRQFNEFVPDECVVRVAGATEDSLDLRGIRGEINFCDPSDSWLGLCITSGDKSTKGSFECDANDRPLPYGRNR